MTDETPPPDSEERPVPFDEWTDLDTLVHRTTITSGDFDYMLNPLCPECGGPLELIYDESDQEESVLGGADLRRLRDCLSSHGTGRVMRPARPSAR